MGPVSVSPTGNLAGPWPPAPPIPAPLRLHMATVPAEWVDYNGHFSEWAYLLVFGDNADAFFRYFGVDDRYRAAGRSLYTAETHLRHLHEARLGERLWLSLQVLGVDTKRLHLAHEMTNSDHRPIATAEQLLLHVDTGAGKVAPFPAQIADRLARIRDAHAGLPVPGYVGGVIRAPRG
jgi:carnitine 3-dehydrogenase